MLANLISPHKAETELDVELDDWKQIIALADAHWVTPALLGPASKLKNVPDEVRDYLVGTHTLNLQRNANHLAAIEELLDQLAKRDIEPVWLKGAASLLTELYDNPGVRMIGDIDFLVPKLQLDATSRCVRELGYVTFPESAHSKSHYHLPRLHNPKTGVALEIHFNVTSFFQQKIIPAEKAIMDRKSYGWRGKTISVMSGKDRIIHNIVHLQSGPPSRCNLRQLLEFELLALKFANEIHWPDVEKRFEVNDFLDGYLDHVTAVREFFDAPDRVSQIHAKRAATRFQKNLIEGFDKLLPETAWKRAIQLLKEHAMVLQVNPHYAMRLFHAKSWTTTIPDILRHIWK